MSPEEVNRLRPGAEHYRAYVGPPREFDFMGATQFRLLCALGLRESHRVLDFGCGSLRLGRLLIPYLLPGGYFGIDPNTWLIEEGIRNEVGQSLVDRKRPAFSDNDDLNCSVFGTRFDYIVAQSILTHCGSDVAAPLIEQFSRVIAPRGLVLVSIIEASDGNTNERAMGQDSHGWVYPDCVAYHERELLAFFAAAGLNGTRIPWFHPRCTWFVASPDRDMLPTAATKRLLTGVVLNADEFSRSAREPE